MFGRANMCKPCAVIKSKANNALKPPKTPEEIEANRIAKREKHLAKAYGITLEDFDIMLQEQGYVCKICGCEAYNERNAFREHLVVDHCHDTGTVRGLLSM